MSVENEKEIRTMYQCLTSEFPRLEKRIKTICNKLDKYGFAYEFKVIGNEIKSVPYYKADSYTKVKINDVLVEVTNYDFWMETLKLGDYFPVAIIEHDIVEDSTVDIKNMVYLVNQDEAVKNEWYNIKGHCDDCHDNYNRKKTIILKDSSGNYRQVGTGCLKKYVGIDCYDIISVYGSVEEILEEELCLYGYDDTLPRTPYMTTEEYLARCIYLINKEGYKKSDCGVRSTRVVAVITEDIDEFSRLKAKEIIKWFRENQKNSEDWELFERNTCAACLTTYTKPSGTIAYAYLCWTKLVEKIKNKEKEEQNKIISQYVGNIGDNIETEVKVKNCFSFENYYGDLSFVNVFEEITTGNVFTWITTSKNFEIDSVLKITGKIKNHKEYNGQKQTVLTRVKII